MPLLVLPAASHGLGLASGFGIVQERAPPGSQCWALQAIDTGDRASGSCSVPAVVASPLRPPLHACRAYSAAATWCRACVGRQYTHLSAVDFSFFFFSCENRKFVFHMKKKDAWTELTAALFMLCAVSFVPPLLPLFSLASRTGSNISRLHEILFFISLSLSLCNSGSLVTRQATPPRALPLSLSNTLSSSY